MEWIITTPEMSHSGILGMHWGRRRYQNKDGSWTEAGKRRRREMSPDAKKRADRKNEMKNLKSKGELDTAKANLKITKAQNKAAVQEAKAGVKTVGSKIADKTKAAATAVKNAAKAKMAERKEAKKEATAEEIIRSGDMQKILKNKDKLTNEQLKAAADRMDLEQRLSGIDAKKKQDAVAAYKRVADVVGTTANLTSNGIVVYNNLSKILATAGITELPLVTATAGRGGSGQSQSSQSGSSHSSGNQSQSSSSSSNSSSNSSSSSGGNSNHSNTLTPSSSSSNHSTSASLGTQGYNYGHNSNTAATPVSGSAPNRHGQTSSYNYGYAPGSNTSIPHPTASSSYQRNATNTGRTQNYTYGDPDAARRAAQGFREWRENNRGSVTVEGSGSSRRAAETVADRHARERASAVDVETRNVVENEIIPIISNVRLKRN